MPNDKFKQNSVSAQGNKPRLAEIRRTYRLRKLRSTVLCVLLTAMVCAYFMGAFGAPLALLGDAVDSFKIAMMPAAGFPVTHATTQYATAAPLAGGLVLMGSREVSMYSAGGNLLRRVPHGYARPCMTTGKNRVCLYSRGDTTLSVESRTRNLFTYTFKEPIILAQMSENGTLAVFTKTTLEVFNPLFESIWTWKNSNEIPLGMAFADDNKRFAVATALPVGGGVGTQLHFFNVRSNAEQATTAVGNGTPVLMRHFGGKLLVIYDTFAALYNSKDGTELVRYDYGARLLQSASVDEVGRVALLFGHAQYPGITSATVLDSALAETARIYVGGAASTISISHRMVHVLTGDSVLTYGLDGEQAGQLLVSTKPFAVLQARRSLLVTADAVRVLDEKETPVEAPSSGAASPSSAAQGEPPQSDTQQPPEPEADGSQTAGAA